MKRIIFWAMAIIAAFAAGGAAVAQTNRPATFFWGEPQKFDAAPVTPYKPVNPARELPVREWDPRSDATREVMSHLNRTVCPNSSTFEECWVEAPPRKDYPFVKEGFLVRAAVAHQRSTAVALIVEGKIPADYGKDLRTASRIIDSGVVRADCSAAFFRFTDMKLAVPVGPYPVIGWNGEVRETVFIDTVPREGSKPGHGVPSTLVKIYRGQALLAVPEVILLERAGYNAIGQLNIHHDGKDVELLHLPRGASGFFTIPKNNVRENDFVRAASNGGGGMIVENVVVERGICPEFDLARHIAKQRRLQ